MPWQPDYTEGDARRAIGRSRSWVEVLDRLGHEYHGKNIETLRKWALRWGISTQHLPDKRRLRNSSEPDLRAAIAASRSWAESLRRLDYCPTGANGQALRRRAALLGISTSHFDAHARARAKAGRTTPLEEVLVERSTYGRDKLKQRLYNAGLKTRRCELCGQGEVWRGQRMGLILDHANGVRDDNRIENLRIVCPNCAATLDTHCGRKNRIPVQPTACQRCSKPYVPRYHGQRYCSRECGQRWDRAGMKRLSTRRVVRPPHEQLVREIEQSSYSAVGRKYGVSDNAIRKWLRAYEREAAETTPAARAA